ncbi:MAG: hypothetical protein AAGC60_19615 [Acidobacteriota bacterium]
MNGASLFQGRLVDTARRLAAGDPARDDDALDALRQRIWAHWMLGHDGAAFDGYAHLAAIEHTHDPSYRGLWRGEQRTSELGTMTPLTVHATGAGHGDLIQWSRWLPLLPSAPVRGLVPAPLLRLFTRSFPAITWRAASGSAPTVVDDATDRNDAPWIDLLRLPFTLRRGLADAAPPYLRVDPAEVDAWRAHLDALFPTRRPRVGLAWTGALAGASQDERSVPMASLAPLLRRHAATADFVSLLHGARTGDLEAAGVADIVLDVGDKLGDFAHAGALLEAVDLLVACDTALVHLAGALARPTLLLLRREAFEGWWLGADARGRRTGWYPSLRLLRQRREGDWSDVVARVDRMLRPLVTLATANAGRRA